MSEDKQRNVLRKSMIRVGAGFVAKERPHVAETLSALGPYLDKWDSHDVNVDVSDQDRGGKQQRVILRMSLPGITPLVAVAKNPDVTRALCDAKRELIRQIEHQKSLREPTNNRRFSATIRHPDTSARPDHRSRNVDVASETQPIVRLGGRKERRT